MDLDAPSPPRRRLRVVRLALLAALLFLGFLAFTLGPIWVKVWWTGLAPATRRGMSVGFLMTCLVGHGLGLAGALAIGTIAAVRVAGGRRMRVRRPWAARGLLLSVAMLFSLGMLELGAWGLAVLGRMPPKPPPVPPKVPTERASGSVLTLLVLGESSAEGQPYEPWFSIGHVIARQVERARPGTKVDLIMGASGGIPLAHALTVMEQQKKRPDIVVLCSGHNEFQARWGWSRVVNYYKDDLIERPRDRLIDRVGDWTPFSRLIRDAVERQSIDAPPTPKEDREVVDRPVCEPETRGGIARLFAQELETVATWCEQAGALPIFVIPSGNDVGYDPGRSILDAKTLKPEREQFGRDFLAARDLEKSDPEAAIAAFRALIDRQPIFAESHFRLAQLLQAKGLIDEARAHYAIARDCDGLPMRCPSEFQEAYRRTAKAHPGVVLVDGPRLLVEFSPTKLLDDGLYHDGQHPSLRAYLRLAQEALDTMRDRGLYGLREANLPPLDPSECAEHFGFSPKASERWALVCRRAASFWGRLASSRYDPSERAERAARLNRAADAIEKGAAPEDVGVPGLGVKPAGFP